MIRQGVSLAGHGMPGRMGGVRLATDGYILRSSTSVGGGAKYPLRVSLSITYGGTEVSKTYRGVLVGVTE